MSDADRRDPHGDEWVAWFRLAHTPGLGRTSARALLAAFGTPQDVLAAPAKAWRGVVQARAAQALETPEPVWHERLAAAQAWLLGKPRRGCLVLGDARYPAALLQTADPPLMLFFEGRLDFLATPMLAIVGSRNPTAQGAENALAFGRELAQRGWTIVSGMARGIDAAAHEGALAAGGPTVAVVGTGPDLVYPHRHTALADRIRAEGLMLSEFAPGTPPLAENFPARNRILCGLSQGVLVVEAALQSGSLITARLAAEAGREVFAIPGSIHSPQSRGCHALLRQGAKLVESVDDVLEELPATGSAPPQGPAPAAQREETDRAPDDDALLRALGFELLTLDALCLRTGMAAREVSARLLELELTGIVVRQPGGLYQRVHRA